MSSSILKLPVYKVFLEQILKAEKLVSDNLQFNQWLITFNCKDNIPKSFDHVTSKTEVIVSNVWIQGKVLYVDNDVLVIDDETGIALVTGLSRLPQAMKNLKVNCFVIVVGHILKAGPFSLPSLSHSLHLTDAFSANIRAMKVTNISNNPNCKIGSWWKKEVVHAQTNVIFSNCDL